jgi:ComF family protein
MIEFAEKYIDMHRFNWLLPVPLHRVKYRERTFNQSAILATELSKRFKTPMLKNNLLRVRLGKPQMTLPKDKRLENIKDSFKIKNPSLLKDKSVLLIDDVFTTGATVNECSKVLKEGGAITVEVLTLAISV